MASTSYLEINFPNLEDSKKNAGKTADKICDYIDEISKQINNKLDDLPGSDTYGYVSSARSLASSKISELTKKAERFNTYKSSIDTFISDSRVADNNVANKIEAVADEIIEKKGFFANLGTAIYDFFCVDLANSNEFTRKVADLVRNVTQTVSSWVDQTINWFKYGEGKYWLNIAVSIGATVLSIVNTVKEISLAIAAVGAIVASGGVALPLVLPIIIHAATALASFTSTAILLNDTLYTIKSNAKAIKMHREGNVNEARYYGNIDGMSDYYERTDLGGEEVNEAFEKKAKNIEKIEKVADLVETIGGVASLGVKKDFRYTSQPLGYKEVGTDFSYENIKKNLMREAGFRYKKVDVVLDDGSVVTRYRKKLVKGFDYDDWSSIEDIEKNVEKFGNSINAIGDFFEKPSIESAADAAQKTLDALDTTGDLFGTTKKYINDVVDIIVTPIELALGV